MSATLAGLALSCGGVLWYLFSDDLEIRTIEVKPVSVHQSGGTVVLDLGRTWFGNIALKPTPENQDRPIVVRMGERLNDTAGVDLTPYGSTRSYEGRSTLHATFVPALPEKDARGLPRDGPAMPFRYIEIEGWQGQFPTDAISVKVYISRRYVERGRIEFLGTDWRSRELNRLMALGVHTMAATSFMGLFIDGDRERLPYQADAYINQLGWYAVTADTKVSRRTIRALLREPTWPTEWMTHLIFLVSEDYAMTGDIDYLRAVYDRLRIFTLLDFIDETGLVSTANNLLSKRFVDKTGADYLQDIVDWPAGERDGYEMVPHNTVVNAFVYQGLRKMADMASALGRTSDVKKYAEAANDLRDAMERQLVDSQSSVFVDGRESRHVSAHALFIPLAFGLVPNARREATLSALKARIAAFDGGFPCSVYGAQYLLDALFDSGEGGAALDLILNKTERGWLHMLDAHDATITHEAWDIKFKPNLDWTHAWGSAFLNVIQRRVLGVQVLKPGWSAWTVRPYARLDIPVKATVPGPEGDVSVEIDPVARLVSVTGAALIDKFVEPDTPDARWTYKIVRTSGPASQ